MWAFSTRPRLRVGREGWKRPRHKAPVLASFPHYQLLSSCLTKLVRRVFESPYLWEELWGREESESLRVGHSDHPAHSSAPFPWTPREQEGLRCMGHRAHFLPGISPTGSLQGYINPRVMGVCICTCACSNLTAAWPHLKLSPTMFWAFFWTLEMSKLLSISKSRLPLMPLHSPFRTSYGITVYPACDRLFLTTKPSLSAVPPTWDSFPFLPG